MKEFMSNLDENKRYCPVESSTNIVATASLQKEIEAELEEKTEDEENKLKDLLDANSDKSDRMSHGNQ